MYYIFLEFVEEGKGGTGGEVGECFNLTSCMYTFSRVYILKVYMRAFSPQFMEKKKRTPNRVCVSVAILLRLFLVLTLSLTQKYGIGSGFST